MIKSFFTVLLQVIMTFCVLFGIYIVFAFLDSEASFDGIISFVIFQPLMGFVLTVATILVCMLAGLPVRTIPALNRWWKTHFYISIAGAILGVIILFMSLLPALSTSILVEEGNHDFLKKIPNPTLAITGWFLTAVCVLHTYLPSFSKKKENHSEGVKE